MLRRIQDLLNTTLIIMKYFMQNHSSSMQLTSPISSENLIPSRLGEFGLQSIDVGGAGDCFFRSVSKNWHKIYMKRLLLITISKRSKFNLVIVNNF